MNLVVEGQEGGSISLGKSCVIRGCHVDSASLGMKGDFTSSTVRNVTMGMNGYIASSKARDVTMGMNGHFTSSTARDVTMGMNGHFTSSKARDVTMKMNANVSNSIVSDLTVGMNGRIDKTKAQSIKAGSNLKVLNASVVSKDVVCGRGLCMEASTVEGQVKTILLQDEKLTLKESKVGSLYLNCAGDYMIEGDTLHVYKIPVTVQFDKDTLIDVDERGNVSGNGEVKVKIHIESNISYGNRVIINGKEV